MEHPFLASGSAVPSTIDDDGPSGSKEADLPGKTGKGGEREGTASGLGEGAAELCALSDQRAQYFIAGSRSQDINYLGRAALKAF